MTNEYVNEVDLYYEVVLSKGKGYLTKKAERYFILIGNNAISKVEKRFRDEDEKYDCLQQGLLHMFKNWHNFNERKFKYALPYLTEIFKRGVADGINVLNNRKSYQKIKPKMISLDSSNQGKGLFNM